MARGLLTLLLLALLGTGWYGGAAQPNARSFAGTGRLERLEAAPGGCTATLRLHRVFSTSQGFGAQPSTGTRYGVSAKAEDCLTLQLALGQPDPGHVFFILGEGHGGWRFLTRPRPPSGCSG